MSSLYYDYYVPAKDLRNTLRNFCIDYVLFMLSPCFKVLGLMNFQLILKTKVLMKRVIFRGLDPVTAFAAF